MPLKEFLEKFPLYRRCKYFKWDTFDQVDQPPIKMKCDICRSEQTFIMTNKWYEGYSYQNYPVKGEVARAVYTCVSCSKYNCFFLIKFSEKKDYIMKVGQDPPWDISMDPNLESMLGEYTDYYKKGLVCESQGYGIGAFSYYRRITEVIIDQLLADIGELIVGDDHKKYIEALEQVQKTRVVQEKIDLVKDLLPPILRPEGMNPLSVLHGVLSEGLHGESDERCMELALNIREILIFLVQQVSVTKKASKGFTESMRRLLKRKEDRAT